MRRALVHELVRRLITRMIEDVIAETAAPVARAVAALGRRRARAPARLVGASRRRWRRPIAPSRDFSDPRMYRHPRVMRIMDDAERVVARSVRALRRRSRQRLPAEWAERADSR